MEVDIENYSQAFGKGQIIAFFTIYVPEMKLRIHNCKVVSKKKGGYFFMMPQYPVEREGVKKWNPIVEFNKEKAEEIVKKTYDILKIFVK